MGHFALAILLIAPAAPGENLVASTAAVAFAALQASAQSSASPSPQGTAQAAPPGIAILRQRGVDAYQAGDYAEALRIFRQVIASDPSDIVAYNISANCSLRLGDYPSAIDSFKHALQLRPDEWHNVSGLMRAYTLAGMVPERDALRNHIAELEHEGKLPPTFNYVFDTFQAGDKKIEVAEFPQIQGVYGERYRFKVFDKPASWSSAWSLSPTRWSSRRGPSSTRRKLRRAVDSSPWTAMLATHTRPMAFMTASHPTSRSASKQNKFLPERNTQ